MDVFLTGATGFVGRVVLSQLRETGCHVRCLVRPAALSRFQNLSLVASAGEAITAVSGDCLDPDSLVEAMQGCKVVIHLIGIIRENPRKGTTFERLHVEATRNLLQAARQCGVERFLHMSALGARGDAPTRYFQTKSQAEQLVARSGLRYVIFRPSVIFGPRDQFVNRLARLVRRVLPAPIIGSGQARLQPVAVENVAQGFVRALTPPGCLNRIFDVGGPRPYSLVEIIDAIGRAKGIRRVRKIHISPAWAKRWVPRLERWPFFPITSEQLAMLEEDNVCDPRPFLRTFAIEPTDFEAGIARYIGKHRRG